MARKLAGAEKREAVPSLFPPHAALLRPFVSGSLPSFTNRAHPRKAEKALPYLFAAVRAGVVWTCGAASLLSMGPHEARLVSREPVQPMYLYRAVSSFSASSHRLAVGLGRKPNRTILLHLSPSLANYCFCSFCISPLLSPSVKLANLLSIVFF